MNLADKLHEPPLDPPEEKKTAGGLWAEISELAENILLRTRVYRPCQRDIDAVQYEVEEINQRLKTLKEAV